MNPGNQQEESRNESSLSNRLVNQQINMAFEGNLEGIDPVANTSTCAEGKKWIKEGVALGAGFGAAFVWNYFSPSLSDALIIGNDAYTYGKEMLGTMAAVLTTNAVRAISSRFICKEDQFSWKQAAKNFAGDVAAGAIATGVYYGINSGVNYIVGENREISQEELAAVQAFGPKVVRLAAEGLSKCTARFFRDKVADDQYQALQAKLEPYNPEMNINISR